MQNIKIAIEGGKKLEGHIKVSGAKNAALPELAAVLLSAEEFNFENVPDVEDIKVIFMALETIGAEGEFAADRIKIRLPSLKNGLISTDILHTSRASILILGPLLARNGYARVSLPGGCPIGDRKINFHLEGLTRMGADIEVREGYIVARSDKMVGIDYTFPGKTVTGTENLLMAAALAEGTTILRNCALEPEIGDLVDLLSKMGADIRGKDTESLVIKGKTSLGGARHRMIPDRIETGTYVIAGCLGDNEIVVENVIPRHIESLLHLLREAGADIEVEENQIRVKAGKTGNISPMDVETRPYPGFPTDLQAQLTTLLTQVEGISRVRENIFNNRFQHAQELNKLGAAVKVEGNTAVIKGKTALSGKTIRATDLRASAALVLGGLIAGGETVVENSYQLFRGYENMPEKLKKLGACVKIL